MVKMNPGKRFEADIIASAPPDVFVHRLRDTAQSYNKSKKTLFTWNNEADFFIYRNPLFVAIECKSTKYKSLSVQLSEDDDDSKMIKCHQIKSLRKISSFDGAYGCFLLNFRDEKNNCERTYCLSVKDFDEIIEKTGKKSINEIDIVMNGGIKVQGNLKKTHYRWDLNKLLDDIYSKIFNN